MRAPLPGWILIAASLAANACGAASDPIGPSPIGGSGGASTMSASVGGVAWGSTTVGVTYAGGALNIVGSDPTFAISFDVALAAPGTYSVTASGNRAMLRTVASSPPASWVAHSLDVGSGSVTVTSLSSQGAAGTFAFTELVASPGTNATGTRTVTQGTFKVKF